MNTVDIKFKSYSSLISYPYITIFKCVYGSVSVLFT